MDSQQVQRLFSTIDSMNADAFVSYLTPEATFRFGSQPAIVGQAGIYAAVSAFWRAIGGSAHRLVRLWRDGDEVAVQGEVTYRRTDGREVVIPFVNVFKMRGEKIAEYLIFIDNGPLWAA